MLFKDSMVVVVKREVRYLENKGVKVPHSLKTPLDNPSCTRKTALAIYDKLEKLILPRSKYFGKSELKEILKALPRDRMAPKPVRSKATLRDKIHGGWLGRCAGCILGKPLEVGLTLPEMRDYLKDDYPIDNYIRFSVAKKVTLATKPGMHPRVTKPCSREHIAYAMKDDDLNYTLINLVLLEQKGAGFATKDVGWIWTLNLPVGATWGAETTALTNYLCGLPEKEIPLYLNPHREEIGAQIRADTFGYACPGDPRRAAALAYKDAAFSHIGEGIYGAMWAAAMIASAFNLKDEASIIRAGLGEIPENCRTATLVRETLDRHRRDEPWEGIYHTIKASTMECSAGDTVNNAAYVANALLAAKGDYEKAVCVAVMQGHDTDCNGATVGSVMGVMLGEKRLPKKWIAPLNNRIQTNVDGHDECRISDLAERTLAISLKL